MKSLFFFISIAVAFISCKKDNSNTNITPSYFTFKIGLNTYQIDTLRFFKGVSTFGDMCINSFSGKSRDGKTEIKFTCYNPQDTISLGTYIVSSSPSAAVNLKRIGEFDIVIPDPLDAAKRVEYIYTEADFSVTISELAVGHISGSIKGKITGGNSTGGFGGSTIINMRTDEIKEGKFETNYYNL